MQKHFVRMHFNQILSNFGVQTIKKTEVITYDFGQSSQYTQLYEQPFDSFHYFYRSTRPVHSIGKAQLFSIF